MPLGGFEPTLSKSRYPDPLAKYSSYISATAFWTAIFRPRSVQGD